MGKPIESPCVSVCQLDDEAGYCKGCLRTITEIAQWGRMSAGERRRIMAQLAARKSPTRQADDQV